MRKLPIIILLAFATSLRAATPVAVTVDSVTHRVRNSIIDFTNVTVLGLPPGGGGGGGQVVSIVGDDGTSTGLEIVIGGTAAVPTLTLDGELNWGNLDTTGAELPQAAITGLVSALAVKQPLDSDLTSIAALTTTAFGRGFLALADAAAVRTLIGGTTLASWGITNGQPLDSDLTSIAALVTDSFGRGSLSQTSAYGFRTYIGGGSAAFAFDGTDRALTGRTTASASIYSTLNHSGAGTYVRNTNSWPKLAGIDLTCVAVYNNSDANVGVTLISPRHIIMSKVAFVANSSTVRFVTNTNTVVSRTLVGSTVVAGASDIRIGILDSDVPATITPAKVLPSSIEATQFGRSFTYVDQTQKAYVGDLYSTLVTGGSLFMGFQESTTALRKPFFGTIAFPATGDRGSPMFFIIDGQPVLAAIHSEDSGGAYSVAYVHSDINTIMTSLGGGYQLTDYTNTVYFPIPWVPAHNVILGYPSLVDDGSGNPVIPSTYMARITQLVDDADHNEAGTVSIDSVTRQLKTFTGEIAADWSDDNSITFFPDDTVVSFHRTGGAYFTKIRDVEDGSIAGDDGSGTNWQWKSSDGGTILDNNGITAFNLPTLAADNEFDGANTFNGLTSFSDIYVDGGLQFAEHVSEILTTDSSGILTTQGVLSASQAIRRNSGGTAFEGFTAFDLNSIQTPTNKILDGLANTFQNIPLEALEDYETSTLVLTDPNADRILFWDDSAGTFAFLSAGSGLSISGTTITATGGDGDVATDVIWDAKGDLVVGTGANTATKLTVGANDDIPVADSSQATGILWTSPGGYAAALGLNDLAFTTPGTGVETALNENVGSVGAFIENGGALGTPSSGTLTNATGLPPAGVTGTAATLGANTFTGAQVNSFTGTASTPAMKYSGVPFAGTGTTSFPLFYINDANATASTTMNTAGTYFGINIDGTQDGINILKDGVSVFKVASTGAITVGNAGTSSFAATGGTTFGDLGTSIGRDVTVGRIFYLNTGLSTAMSSEAAAIVQLGADAAGVTNYILKAADRITSDGVGANLTIAGGRNRGADVGGSIIFQTSPAAAATVTGTLATALTIDSTKTAIYEGPVRLKGYTVSTLPTGTQGNTAFVTDATAPTYLGTLTGGGAVVCPVFYNGSAWVSH